MIRKSKFFAGLAAGFLLILGISGFSAPGAAGQIPMTGEPGLAPAERSSTKKTISPFARPGMWIWYISSSEKGNLDRIIRKAKAHGIGTLYIKSADGTGTWRQFTRPMVRRFRDAGLDVCGWHYVYGRKPVAEARASAYAKRQGANCFVIDAEIEYESNNQYAKADRYIRKLRRLVGPNYRLGFTSFPYTHYHRAMPYSVFLGPGGATANLPQIYWKTIGDTVRQSISVTWKHNSLYRRKIYPLGQTYSSPSRRSVVNFRRFVQSYDTAPSWWSWQHTGKSQWGALRKKVGRFPTYRPERSHMVLKSGSSGDQVVWLQQHLRGAGYRGVPVSGIFNQKTRSAVERFQQGRGLVVDGVVGTATWNQLLKVKPVRIRWAGKRSLRSVGTDRAPKSASLPPVRNELSGKPHRGPAQSG